MGDSKPTELQSASATGVRRFPITIESLYDWFPCAHVENPFAGEAWWQLQALGTLAATQLLRLLPEGDVQQQALIELRRTIDTALLVIPVPPDEVIYRRMAQTLAPSCPTPFPVLDAMLDLADLTTDDYLVDLGSGDGRIVFAAAARGVRAHGIEIDGLLVAQAQERRLTRDQSMALASFEHGDVLTADLSKATVVTCYLLSASMNALAPKLRALRPGSRIISHAFDIAGWLPTRTVTVEDTPVYVWHIEG